ncbi:MAG: hypothetical protein QOK31_43 [Solirubrobacteraceae bacterium]|jgi:hypothetical protein|nr:hypothetical protein [Solirubrobacteraceae bacterium]
MRMVMVVMAGAAVLVVAGCGNKKTYANNLRPPVVLNVTAAISDREVLLSPKVIGAGPIHLVVTNQSTMSRKLVLESVDSGAGPPTTTSAPINPQGTAEVNLDLPEGDYRVVATGGGRAAMLSVSGHRKSGQNEVLQP